MKRIASLALAAIFSLSLVACSQDEVTATLGGLVNAAVAAADIAYPQDAALLNAVTTICIDPAIDTLGGPGTGAQKSLAILTACAPQVTLLSHSTGLQAVSAALTAFLDSVKGLTAEVQSTPAGANAFFGSTKAASVSKAKLKKLRGQVALLKAKLNTGLQGPTGLAGTPGSAGTISTGPAKK